MLTGATSGASGAGASSGAGPGFIGAGGALSSALAGVGASSAVVGAPVASGGANGQTILDAARLELPFGLDRPVASPMTPLEIHETSMKLEAPSEQLDAANKGAVDNQALDTTATEPEEKEIGAAQLDSKVVDQSEEMAGVECTQTNPDPEEPPVPVLCNHNSCIISSLKGARNGFYYGSRLRFAHSFVMGVLFGKGTLEDRLQWALKMAYSHGKLLATFVFAYKASQCILTHILRRSSPIISFFAGLIGSRLIIRPENREFTSINRQLAYYLVSRILEGIVAKLQKLRIIPQFEGFTLTYLLVWGLVMYLFELDKSILNKSLVASMDFLYKESDKDVEHWTDFVPVDVAPSTYRQALDNL